MPTYEYRCDKCSEAIDYVLSISNRDSKIGQVCTACNDGHLVRAITVPHHGDALRMGFTKTGIKEVLQKIHARTPGSQLDKNSHATPI